MCQTKNREDGMHSSAKSVLLGMLLGASGAVSIVILMFLGGNGTLKGTGVVVAGTLCVGVLILGAYFFINGLNGLNGPSK
jgi:hypothetical protein